MREPDIQSELPRFPPFPSSKSFTHITAENQASQLEGCSLDDAGGYSVVELVEASVDEGVMIYLSLQAGSVSSSRLQHPLLDHPQPPSADLLR